jgi:predicted dehydrogenase
MKKVRWAVIGATGFARLRTIPEGILGAPNAELSAILARDENRLREVARDFGDVFHTNDMGVLLARADVDAVYIATPTKDHEKQTLAALRAGKHVLVEKPCAMNTRQARTLQSVLAVARNLVHRYSAEDSAVVLLEFQSGALGVVEAFFNIPVAFNALEISGTRGSLCATGTSGQSSGGELVLRAAPRGLEKALQYPSINPYYAEIEDFSRAVLRGDSASFDFSDGLRSARVADAVYRAAKSGRRQQVSSA